MNQECCPWANRHPLEREYHDHVWGKPIFDDLELFKMLMLECNQAGLSWTTIMKKMDTMLEAYDQFNPHVLIHYDDKKKALLLTNDGIIKNRLKINAAIHNAHVYFDVCHQYGSLSDYLWGFVDHTPIINHPQSMADIPATTPLSDEISKSMKKLGFKFVGSTTIYALMQAVGMVNDHIESCPYKY